MRYPTFDLRYHEEIVVHTDYTRFALVGVALERLRSEKISGHLAEVGVYRGELSRFIHRVDPDRRLYLFDTFEGFPSQDLEDQGRIDTRFQDTSVDQVLRTIGDSTNVVIKKGRVPETLADLGAEQFAFLLLDLDLYNPTLSSLQFFYPRLTSGAYVLVHDYNSPESHGACKRALDEFIVGKPEKVIDVPDVAGTAIFRKL
jgi:O-methyltransferase